MQGSRLLSICQRIGVVRKQVAKTAHAHHDVTRAHVLVQILEADLRVPRRERVRFQRVARAEVMEFDLFWRQQAALVAVGDRLRVARVQVAEVTNSTVALALAPNHHESASVTHTPLFMNSKHRFAPKYASGLFSPGGMPSTHQCRRKEESRGIASRRGGFADNPLSASGVKNRPLAGIDDPEDCIDDSGVRGDALTVSPELCEEEYMPELCEEEYMPELCEEEYMPELCEEYMPEKCASSCR